MIFQYLAVLPWLLNAACLALLDAAIPMRCIFTSTIIAMISKTITREHPSIKEMSMAESLHVLTFSSTDELLLAESEGRFSMDVWDEIADKAKIICLGDADAMVDEQEERKSLQDGLKSAIEKKVRENARWKDG